MSVKAFPGRVEGDPHTGEENLTGCPITSTQVPYTCMYMNTQINVINIFIEKPVLEAPQRQHSSYW